MADKSGEKEAIVIGAGIMGVCSAWHLQRRGFRVTVVDKKPPAEETSWGNAGLIQRECVLPYNLPEDWKTRFDILFNRRNSMRCNHTALTKYWNTIFQYWMESHPRYYDKHAREFATLVEHCITEHEVLIKATKMERIIRKGGFIEFFRTKPLAEIEEFANKYRERGVNVDVLSPAALHEAERHVDTKAMSGAVRFVDAWRVTDPGALVKAYAANVTSGGGKFIEANVEKLTPPAADGDKWVVHTDKGDLSAPNVVVAVGPWSGDFLRSLGYSFPIYTLRGYNAHFKAIGDATLQTSLLDVENGMAISPMEQGIRITSGAELNLVSNPPEDRILNSCAAIVRTFFPLGEQITPLWYGHRPCMADMKPVIGESARQRGLWMCFGHGHSGFTLGPVSGRVLAEMMNGEKPLVDPRPFDPNRF